MVRVRPAVLGDARDLARVHVESWRWAYAGLLPPAYLDGLSEARRERFWTGFIGRVATRTATWVAHDASGCCGLASAGPARPEEVGVGEVYTLYVSARSAGRGVGHALLAYVVAQLKVMLFGSAMLWVLEQNQRARRFYEREGWWPDGARGSEDLARLSLPTVRYRRAL